MSFGYSVGDFFTVVQFAFKVYEKCRDSRSELRDLGRDVGNAHLVLRNIHRFWEAEKNRNHDLLIPQQDELKQLAEACGEALQDIEEIQRKHKDLDTSTSWVKRATSRSKYAMADIFGDIGSAREKLQRNTGNLALLHTMLTTDALHEASHETSNSQKETLEYLKQQADIIQVFVKTYRDLQEGKGTAPAYSQVARGERPEDQAEKTVEAAKRDLLAEGIDNAVILKHRDLIKEWLETVILPAEEDDEEETAVEGQSAAAVVPSAEKDILANQSERSPDPVVNQRPAQPIILMRSTSVSTHRSQSSSWTPQDEETTSEYAADMIAKVLRSKYAPSYGSEAFSLPLKRAFHNLDWRKRGWLARAVVEEQCGRASANINFNLDLTELAKAIKAEDEKGGKPDHHIDEPEFINIVLFVREVLRSAIERRSIAKGLGAAAAEITRWQEQQNKKIVSPLWSIATRYRKIESQQHGYWKKVFRIEPFPVFTHRFGGDIAPNELPLARNATYAIYIATKYCVTSVDGAFHRLRHILKDWGADDEEEVVELLNTTMETAALFHHFESPEGLGAYHWLDEFIDVASVLPLSHFPDLQGCPLKQALSLITNLWSVLDTILGLASDIQFFAYGSPLILKWRESRVLDRARDLAAQASSVLGEERTSSFKHIDTWYHKHQSILFKHQKTCETTTYALKKEQQEVAEIVQSCRIAINWPSLGQLPKALGFRRPSTFYNAFCDGKLIHRSELMKSTSPTYNGFQVQTRQSSTIKIEFYDETKMSDPLGFIEFNVKDNVDFARGAEVYLEKVIGKSNIKASLRVKPAEGERNPAPFSQPFTDETDAEELKRKLLEIPLPSYILSQAIPSGWKILRNEDSDANQNGVYFWHVESSQPTAILWHDPYHIITQDDKLDYKDLDQKLQPVRYHFPEAFHIGKEGDL